LNPVTEELSTCQKQMDVVVSSNHELYLETSPQQVLLKNISENRFFSRTLTIISNGTVHFFLMTITSNRHLSM